MKFKVKDNGTKVTIKLDCVEDFKYFATLLQDTTSEYDEKAGVNGDVTYALYNTLDSLAAGFNVTEGDF